MKGPFRFWPAEDKARWMVKREEGISAFKAGGSINDCPYPVSWQAKAWRGGFSRAEAQAQGINYTKRTAPQRNAKWASSCNYKGRADKGLRKF